MLEVILGLLVVGIGIWAVYLRNRLNDTSNEKTQYGIILEMATQERESLMVRIEELSGQVTGMQSQVGFLHRRNRSRRSSND